MARVLNLITSHGIEVYDMRTTHTQAQAHAHMHSHIYFLTQTHLTTFYEMYIKV